MMEQIAVYPELKRLKAENDELKKKNEDLEERIAIMSEGGLQELFLDVLEKYKDEAESNIWERSGSIDHDVKELEKEVAEYKRKAGIKVDDSEEGEET